MGEFLLFVPGVTFGEEVEKVFWVEVWFEKPAFNLPVWEVVVGIVFLDWDVYSNRQEKISIVIGVGAEKRRVQTLNSRVYRQEF